MTQIVGNFPIRQWHCWKGLFHHKLGNDVTRGNTTLESTNYIYIIRCECIQGFVDRNYSFWGVLTSNGGVVVATADRAVLLIGSMGLVYLPTLTYIYLWESCRCYLIKSNQMLVDILIQLLFVPWIRHRLWIRFVPGHFLHGFLSQAHNQPPGNESKEVEVGNELWGVKDGKLWVRVDKYTYIHKMMCTQYIYIW